MRIYLPREMGFCFGVKKAIARVEDELKRGNDKIYCLGDLIHNPKVMEDLKRKGLKVIQDINQVKEGTVFTRAHGVDYKIVEEGKKKGLKIVETTCPYVLKVQKIARALAKKSYQIIMVGSVDHPEVKAVISNTPTDKLYVVKDPEQVMNIPLGEKVGVIAQTTESLDNFENIVKNLIKYGFEIRIFNTLCEVVRERQKETLNLAKKVEAMLVVGGHNSSNTGQLVRLCRSIGVRTYFVEGEEDINYKEIEKMEKIGITGGTSTPEKMIRNIKEVILKKLNKNTEGRGG
ncbi:MAG TPA: 4-hydroxy-3-methylbut-2-enyl diphosphate reductase [Candidatus Aerophobetes bacterium]|uniref:4-hydroxy-3-methylbut-2-enyl diphosphate reductase n=1 Tax=Aerophobetes bacterium TaxID=2030807 RepID=A0A7V0N032_UNCAE|nr:4-hydroxy-3-methylbut-2-enyl diphosphate reductase [Candidatus Aerophobetes bacterium]